MGGGGREGEEGGGEDRDVGGEDAMLGVDHHGCGLRDVCSNDFHLGRTATTSADIIQETREEEKEATSKPSLFFISRDPSRRFSISRSADVEGRE